MNSTFITKIKGIIFDFDGLILDTETPEMRSWEIIFSRYGVKFPISTFLSKIGSHYDDITPAEDLKRLSGKQISTQDIQKEFRELKTRLIHEESLCPGVLDYLIEAKSKGIKVGLASSSTSSWIDYHIDRFKIRDYFDSILTKNHVERVKPYPDLFLLSISDLHLDATEVIVLEDSPNGVKAAKSAQLLTIAVPNKTTASSDFSNADIILNSLIEISLSDLFELIERKYKND